MLKLKNARNLDARQSMLVDHAYFTTKLPRGAGDLGSSYKVRPMPREFIRHLTYDRLTTHNVKQVRGRGAQRLHAMQVSRCQPLL